MSDYGTTYSTTILMGESQSGPLDLGDNHLFAIKTPAALDDVTMSFLGMTEGDLDYLPMYDENGSEKVVTVAVNRLIVLDPLPWLGIRWFKLRMGTAAIPTVQSADRVFELIVVR